MSLTSTVSFFIAAILFLHFELQAREQHFCRLLLARKVIPHAGHTLCLSSSVMGVEEETVIPVPLTLFFCPPSLCKAFVHREQQVTRSLFSDSKTFPHALHTSVYIFPAA